MVPEQDKVDKNLDLDLELDLEFDLDLNIDLYLAKVLRVSMFLYDLPVAEG